MAHPASCKQPTLTVSSEKYAKLVYESTQQLHQSLQPVLSALNRRAIGFAKCVNYESAFRDAHLIQQLSPSTALGYLCEATIYSEQGKQYQVIDICNKGLSKVDTSDSHYATLLQAKIDAKQQQDTCVDFISQLPKDIVITTLIPMIVKDNLMPCPYVQVADVWSDRIIECFKGLRFEVDEDDDDMSDVIQFAEHTTSLHVSEYSEGTWLGDLISDNPFSSLQKITVAEFTSDDIDHFVSSLQNVSSTLTALELNMMDGPELRPTDILMVCPNLISLEITGPLDGNINSQRMTTWPALTTLYLMGTRNRITCDQIINMWKQFPALKELTLSPCTDIQPTLIVSEHCPSMNCLELWNDDSDITLTFSDEGNHGHGITKIIIGVSQFDDDTCKDTTSIIKQHHDTLEHLRWEMDTSWDTETIDNIQFPRLKVLRIGFPGWQIPRNAPMLEEFRLSSRTIRTHPAVLDMIPPRLTKLELALHYHASMVDPVDPPVIVRYLNSIAQQRRLKELVIHFNNGQQNIIDMLDAIYNHHHLECLKIGFTVDLGTYEMERFLDGLVKSCPRLARLELECVRAPSIHAINALKKLEHLTHLRLPFFGMDNADKFWYAIQTLTPLKYISIDHAANVKKQHVKHLKQHRPDIKINLEMFTVLLSPFKDIA
ncbi:hypothetical protein O0I10_006308 [Lichtheimia ornata]|uniref:F-box domain-containing protein n=1 Tax=Lichtheimia ornata TaxID=688661 RepID=A0AAD7V4K8_9FUNG|nr:uncharacterized protein O0I10_006308 [Lichtheimia ornata]KAJ8658037.1 hypothetical protein O0I10_006308 [Lichtheimia ornata]